MKLRIWRDIVKLLRESEEVSLVGVTAHYRYAACGSPVTSRHVAKDRVRSTR
jgi:hypothetical protein